MNRLNKEKKKINRLLEQYNFSSTDKEKFWIIINPIIEHEEFLKRFNPKVYPHHGKVSLGTHIIEDAIVTYVLAKEENLDVYLAVVIAMFHDLYELPWQNAKISKKQFVNKHGFVHPIEAVINAYYWYPEYFQENSEVIVDGIIHHMYPFPVRAINTDWKNLELNNAFKLDKIDDNLKKLLIVSTLNKQIGNVSWTKSKFREGQVMSKADKIVSFNKDLKSIKSLLACITGKNSEVANSSRILVKKSKIS